MYCSQARVGSGSADSRRSVGVDVEHRLQHVSAQLMRTYIYFFLTRSASTSRGPGRHESKFAGKRKRKKKNVFFVRHRKTGLVCIFCRVRVKRFGEQAFEE